LSGVIATAPNEPTINAMVKISDLIVSPPSRFGSILFGIDCLSESIASCNGRSN